MRSRTILGGGCVLALALVATGCAVAADPTDRRTVVARLLIRRAPPAELDLRIIPVLNPDGAAAGSRGNARGVDLNRRPLTGVYYCGRQPLFDPESRVAYRLISKLRPQVSIWFHQHLDVVDEWGRVINAERRFVQLVGLGLVRLTRDPGSVVDWEDHRASAATAFVVELPAGPLGASPTCRFARAVLAVASAPSQ